MKFGKFILYTALVFTLSACPGNSYKDDLKSIQDNNMDFPDLQKTYYDGINFELSSLFRDDYSDYYVIQDNALTKVIYGIDVHFSIEAFSEDEAEDIRFTFEEDIDHLNAVHDHYVYKRANTLSEPIVSIKKELAENVRYDGYIQVIHGTGDDYYQDESSYFTASLKIGDEYYIVQLIGKRVNMGYLYDDFLDILSSIN